MTELQDKALELLFSFMFEAKTDEKFIIEPDKLTTINKDGVERVIPIEFIEKPSKDFFIFTKSSLDDAPHKMRIIRTLDNIFLFSPEKLRETIKAKKNLVKNKGDIWLIKSDELINSAFHRLMKVENEQK